MRTRQAENWEDWSFRLFSSPRRRSEAELNRRVMGKNSDAERSCSSSFRKTRDGFGLVVMHVKNRIELGNLQQVMNLLGEVKKFQLPTLIGHRRKRAHQLADPRTVDIGDVGKIHQYVLGAAAQLVANHLAQLDATLPQRNPSAHIDDGDGINLSCCGLHAHGPFLLDWASNWR